MFELKNINLKDLETNSGQIEGLPKNPRFIRDDKFAKLKQSIEDAPEMLSLRELLVYPHNDKFVIISGNMRYRAMKDLGMATAPCKVLDIDTPVEKLREYTIKDNNAFGQNDWDILANEWEQEELEDWGMELQDFNVEEEKEEKQEATEEETIEETDGDKYLVEVVCANEKEQNQVFDMLDSKGYVVRFKFK